MRTITAIHPRRACALAALLLLAALVPATGRADDPAPRLRPGAHHAVPLYGELLRIYDAPDDPYAPGHRGVDTGADRGTAVRASADGTVRFAGSVAGNRTVSVDHADGLVTSYSYLGSISVTEGQSVSRGQTIGTVGDGHPAQELPPHVHLSARRDGVYLDPLELYVGTSHADLLSLVE